MSTADYLQSIVAGFRLILDAHDKHLKYFDQHAVQVESWFKGELLPLFESEKIDGRLVDFYTEVPAGGGRVDYQLLLPDSPVPTKVWIELKHFLQQNTLPSMTAEVSGVEYLFAFTLNDKCRIKTRVINQLGCNSQIANRLAYTWRCPYPQTDGENCSPSNRNCEAGYSDSMQLSSGIMEGIR